MNKSAVALSRYNSSFHGYYLALSASNQIEVWSSKSAPKKPDHYYKDGVIVDSCTNGIPVKLIFGSVDEYGVRRYLLARLDGRVKSFKSSLLRRVYDSYARKPIAKPEAPKVHYVPERLPQDAVDGSAQLKTASNVFFPLGLDYPGYFIGYRGLPLKSSEIEVWSARSGVGSHMVFLDGRVIPKTGSSGVPVRRLFGHKTTQYHKYGVINCRGDQVWFTIDQLVTRFGNARLSDTLAQADTTPADASPSAKVEKSLIGGFVLATQMEDGKLAFGSNPVVHTSLDSAKTEAVRVAGIARKKIVVLRVHSTVVVGGAVWEG